MARTLLSLALTCLLYSTCASIEEPGSIELSANILPSCSQPLDELHDAIQAIFPAGYTVFLNCLSFDEEGSLFSGVVSGTSATGPDERFDLSCSSNSIIVATPSSLPVDNTSNNLIGSTTSCLSCNTSASTGSCGQLCTSVLGFSCERCYEGPSRPSCSLCIACISQNAEPCSSPSSSICRPQCVPGAGPFVIVHEDHNHCVCNGSFRLSENPPIPTAPPEFEEFECEEGDEEILLRGSCEVDCDEQDGFERNPETGVCWACGINYCVECSRNPNSCDHCYENTVLYKGECYSCPLAEIAFEAIEQENERRHEEEEKEHRTLELAVALPIVVVLIIVFFVSMSVFAHHRYPHVSFHGQKRHRKPPTFDQAISQANTDDEQPPQPSVSQVWRPRPTIVLR